MVDISRNIALIRTRIHAAEERFARARHSVKLLAVSKTQAADAVRQAHAAGQLNFGENYLQEALAKQAELADLPLTWHFIGPIQSNKTRAIAEHFAWVHSVDRLKIAQKLSEYRPKNQPPLQICLQVNVSGEASKSGCAPSDLAALTTAVKNLPGLCLRGLMAIPEPSADFAAQRRPLALLRELRDQLAANDPSLALDSLSMGMSDDLEAAVAEGATWVRIGSALFGPRQYPAR